MEAFIQPTNNSRLGIHYYPDTLHYGEADLKTWLPELKAMDINWLTLIAPGDRAIPENFLTGLIEAGIEPILHFQLPLVSPALTDNHKLLLDAYAKWGIHYVVFFDRPNSRIAWPANTWAQADLVERFLDLFLPLAEAAISAGLIPVFPPLEPGGDYWDTAFLRAALQGIQRRNQGEILRSMVLGAYAGVEGHPLDWGAGGPECWPGARPYFTPAGQQDQCGFYIFDWYLAITKAVLGDTRPIFLFGAGSRLAAGVEAPEAELEIHAQENLILAQSITGDAGAASLLSNQPSGRTKSSSLPPIPSEVITCNFWLLAADPSQPQAGQAWFKPDGISLPIVASIKSKVNKNISRKPASTRPTPAAPFFMKQANLVEENRPTSPIPVHPIAHYLLLPVFEWGIADWQLEAIRPFIKRYHPTVGFSIEEASLAARVTVIGGPQIFPDETLEVLIRSGCRIDQISGDGTSIATQLAVR